MTDLIKGVIPICNELRSRDIKIGSTTGYTKKMMNVVTGEAARKGYAPDSIVTPEDVDCGRPYPYMIYRNMQNLELFPPKRVIKAGDTISDIKEGINSGVWSVGVIAGSSEMGLSREEYNALTDEQKETICTKVQKKYFEAGADRVIHNMGELPALIDEINKSQTQYPLLTPGPLSTTKTVKEAMLKDWCTWDSVASKF